MYKVGDASRYEKRAFSLDGRIWLANVFVKYFFFFFQAEDGIRDLTVTGVQTCALPISKPMGCRHGLVRGLPIDVQHSREREHKIGPFLQSHHRSPKCCSRKWRSHPYPEPC